MSELVRFSVSLEEALLAAFDKSLAEKGGGTRSEAVRDLIRDRLLQEEAEQAEGEGVVVVVVVYDHHAHDVSNRLIHKQHHHHERVVSTMHVHLGAHHCLEITILRGPNAEIRHLGDELVAMRGILFGQVTLAGDEQTFRRWSPNGE